MYEKHMYEKHRYADDCRCFNCTMGTFALQRAKASFEFAEIFAGQIEGSPFFRVNNTDYDVRALLKVTMVFYAYCRTLGDIAGLIQNAVGGDLDTADAKTIPPELALYLARGAEAQAHAAIPIMATAGIIITEQESGVH